VALSIAGVESRPTGVWVGRKKSFLETKSYFFTLFLGAVSVANLL